MDRGHYWVAIRVLDLATRIALIAQACNLATPLIQADIRVCQKRKNPLSRYGGSKVMIERILSD